MDEEQFFRQGCCCRSHPHPDPCFDSIERQQREIHRLHSFIREQRHELILLREDAERLDWLENYLLGDGCIGRDVTRDGRGSLNFGRRNAGGNPETARQGLREAIRAAREEGEG